MARVRVPLFPPWLRWIGVLGVTVTIIYFSLLTAPPPPPEPGPFWDKKLHFAAYGAFTLALAYATAKKTNRSRGSVLFVIACSVLFGVSVELGQWVLPARYFATSDILANTVGTFLAAVWFRVEPRIQYRPITHSPGTYDS